MSRNTFYKMPPKGSIVPLHEFHAFVTRCLKAVGTSRDHGFALADMLVSADYRGHHSQGLNKLDMYVNDVRSKTIAASGTPEIVKETMATALVEGNNVLGPVIGRFCMDLAIKKAKEVGFGWVSARGSNHFGMAGWYGLRALEQGMIGMVLTNTSPMVAPTNAKEVVLGTNPMCVAAPAQNGDSFILDMATTRVPFEKIELEDRKDQSLAVGWAVDKGGQSTTNPKAVTGLTPLGGAENTSGYGLSMMVEICCGILSGSKYASHIRSRTESQREANLGQSFLVVDPNAFAPGFNVRLSDLLYHCRNLEPAEDAMEVLVAGDAERQHMEKCDKQGGILYHPNQVEDANEIAASLDIETIKTL